MQELLVPIILEGSASVAARLQEMNELLEPMHIHLENFGQNSLICRQLPAWMSEIDEQAFLQDVLDLWKDGREVRAEDLQRHRLATIACHHSIRFNRVLSLGEMQEVIEQLARCEQPYHCPHGRADVHHHHGKAADQGVPAMKKVLVLVGPTGRRQDGVFD